MSRWSGARHAPATRRATCRDCGAPIERFRTEYGLDIPLEPRTVPADRDLSHPDNRHRVYEWRGPRLGWCHQFVPARRGRDIRLAHRCA